MHELEHAVVSYLDALTVAVPLQAQTHADRAQQHLDRSAKAVNDVLDQLEAARAVDLSSVPAMLTSLLEAQGLPHGIPATVERADLHIDEVLDQLGLGGCQPSQFGSGGHERGIGVDDDAGEFGPIDLGGDPLRHCQLQPGLGPADPSTARRAAHPQRRPYPPHRCRSADSTPVRTRSCRSTRVIVLVTPLAVVVMSSSV